MGTFNNIQIALDTALAAVPSIPPVAWANTKYTPVAGTTFVRPTLLPATSVLKTLNEYKNYPGLYQIDIFTPLEKGEGAGLVVADAIKTYYEAHRRLVANSDTIFVKEVSLGKGERQDAWNHIYVEIKYDCYSL